MATAGSRPGAKQLLGLPLKGQVIFGAKAAAGKGLTAKVIYISSRGKRDGVMKKLRREVASWSLESAEKKPRDLVAFDGKEGPVIVLQDVDDKLLSKKLGGSRYGVARDLCGRAMRKLATWKPEKVVFEFIGAKDEEKLGAFVGTEIASYRYKEAIKKKSGQGKTTASAPRVVVAEADVSIASRATPLGVGVNVARHLVNSPAEDLNPKTYASQVKGMFANSKTVTVDVVSGKRLERERCGMLMAVGRAAEHGPCLIHIKHRPRRSGGKQPVAFVGKGITFDSGGLDIKSAAGMRLMKKDMGGSASLVGLAYWLNATGLPWPVDIYLAVAENAVAGHAFRPGDILKSRKGDTVEIHNTDAEGRLVLGDALDYAITRKGADKPGLVIDVATLTGAMRVGLGLKYAGLFASDDHIAATLQQCGREMDDPCWHMPLVPDYNDALKSQFADCSNAANTPFGGAITAALFLQRFVGEVPWAHFDLMAWSDKAHGPWAEVGGSGQLVQALARFMEHFDGSLLE